LLQSVNKNVPMLNIFILNYDSVTEIEDCLKSISASDFKDFRVILINNYSSVTDLINIRNVFSKWKEVIIIYLIENENNLGYAGGNNSGLKFLKDKDLDGDILILNSDIIVFENTISEMVKAINNGLGIITARTLNQDGDILFDAIKLKGFSQKYITSDKRIIETDYSQGSCMLITRNDAVETGLFDERFFMYWEEVDLSLRLRASGKNLITVTTAKICKKRNNEFREPLVIYYSVRNARLILKKHPDQFSFVSYLSYLIKIFFLLFKFLLKPRIFYTAFKNFFQGIIDSKNIRYFIKTDYSV
jgi:GT2 family glycosyltransferase